jgi:serine/threonine protein phosphatase PrpC
MVCPSCNTLNRDDAKFCKGCGKPLHAQFASVPAAPDATQVEGSQVESPSNEQPQVENEQPSTGQADEAQAALPPERETGDDPSLAPTLILTPEKMMAYHQRRWSMEAQSAIEDMPTVLMSPSNEHEHEPIPIPPPPPPESLANNGTASAEYSKSGMVGQAASNGSSSSDQPGMEQVDLTPPSLPADQPTQDEQVASQESEMSDASETPQTSPYAESAQAEQEAHDEQPETGEQAEQETSDKPGGSEEQAGDFPVLAVGATLIGRYEVTQVVSDNPQEHVYQVVDHQGYHRCWNCGSEQNAEGDDFCIDCGASLLNVPYILHEYSPQQSTDDAPVLQGAIINTFVDQGRTYAVEQMPSEQSAFPNGVLLEAATASDAGNVRRSDPNEDSTLLLQIQRVHESLSAPVGVYIVADGMGGHDYGQVASRMAINIIAERMVRELLLAPLATGKNGEAPKPFDEDAMVALLHDSVDEANNALCQKNAQEKTDMGSTLTGFMVVGEHAYIVNVGDSRTYMVRGGQLYQLTTDHSLVGQLVASGLIEPDDVYTHPQRSQIFRSLGDKPTLQIDIFKQQLHPGDILLSCCDGLWEMVRNPQIESILNNAPDPQTACAQLIDAANTNGGEDNISAVIVFVR